MFEADRARRKNWILAMTAVLVFFVGATPAAAQDLSPPTLVEDVYPGDVVYETKTVFVPPNPPKVDVVFAFDLTGSMSGIINSAKSKAATIIAQLDLIPDVSFEFGVMSYMDYPKYYSSCGYSANYGDASRDYAYRLDQAVTDISGDVVDAINALAIGSGWDGPQDYTRIFYESYADPNVAWRDGAKKILINFGDNVPHDCNLNEGVAGGTWSTGGDPGRDEIMGTGDDLDLQTVLNEMWNQGIVLLEAHTTTAYSTHWDYWTGLTGGNRFVTTSASLVDDIVAEVVAELDAPMVYGLHLEASGAFDAWLYTSPPDMDVDPGDSGVSVYFDVEIEVPDPQPIGVNAFTISALDEAGVSYGDQSVTLTVLNRPPVAYCQDVEVLVDGTCQGDADVNDGSYDPDAHSLTYEYSPAGPYPLGDTLVTMTATDEYGDSDTCTGTVSIIDNTPPEAFCNSPATIIPPDAPIDFTSGVADVCDATVEIVGYDCWTINGAGKLISKLESCEVSIDGDTITIEDSGGVGDNIEWFVIATDSSGNTTGLTCSLEVIRKPKSPKI